MASGPVAHAAQGPSTSASAAILINGSTGHILYGKDILGEYYPASITKIMTAYLAITQGWRKTVVVSAKAASQIGSTSDLRVHEREPMPKVVTSMMLVSGNDAAYAVAETVSGSASRFVALMNATARAWHAPGIHFVNPDGLPSPHHVVSALGMAVIAQHAMKNPIFARIVRTKHSSLPPDPNAREYYNQNQLLYDYPGAVGIKIGYTMEADETIVGAANRHGMFLIEVLLHDTPQGLWPDSKHLLNWGFSHYRPQTLVRDHQHLGTLVIGGRKVVVESPKAFKYLVPIHDEPGLKVHIQPRRGTPNRPLKRHQAVGDAILYLGKTRVGEVPAITVRAVAALPPPIHRQWAWLLLPLVVVATSLARVRGRRSPGQA